jgi:hypothetical protein
MRFIGLFFAETNRNIESPPDNGRGAAQWSGRCGPISRSAPGNRDFGAFLGRDRCADTGGHGIGAGHISVIIEDETVRIGHAI